MCHMSSQIDEIKSRLNIVDVISSYIKLQKAGVNYRANCPFHSEKTPSFFVSPARQIWHCFGSCGIGGDIFKFVMQIEGVEFGDALRILASKAGVELVKQDPKIKTERQRLFEMSELACRFFEKQLEESQTGKEAKKYLFDRGMAEETIRKWRLGYSPDSWRGLRDFLVSQGYKTEEIEKAGLILKSEKSQEYFDRFRARIMFPISNSSSQVIGFGARVFKNLTRKDGTPESKYVNSPNTLIYDKSRVLFGLNKAGLEARKKDFSVLMEGYMDVIMAHQAGIENAVATSGTALTSFQLDILRRYSDNIHMCFDMDLAGQTATKKGIDLAQAMSFNIKIITMPENPETPGIPFKDSADLVKKDPELLKKAVAESKTIFDFYFEKVLSQFDRKTMEGKKKISKTILPAIKKIQDKIEQDVWIKKLAEVLEVNEDNVLEELKKARIEEDFSFKEEIPYIKEEKLTRKALLEQYLSALAFKSPQSLQLIKEEDFASFSSQYAAALKHLKGGAKEPEASLKELLDCLALRAETLALDKDIVPEKEFASCFKEIKMIEIKNKQEDICLALKEAEKAQDSEKIGKLTQEFNSLSLLRHNLETS